MILRIPLTVRSKSQNPTRFRHPQRQIQTKEVIVMAKAVGDPDDLERFAHSLQQFIDTLNEAVGNLNGAFAMLGDTWQDQKRAQFEEEYHGLVQQLRQFDANASEQIPYLTTLATRLRDYLQS
jgi:hypothetical protein